MNIIDLEKKRRNTRYIVTAAVIAAAYAALTYVSYPLSYGAVQIRISEALNVLAFFTPAAVPGLAVGCLIGNIGSTLGVWDMLFGTAATVLTAVIFRLLKKASLPVRYVAAVIVPTLINALFVGGEIVLLLASGGGKAVAFLLTFSEVAIGEAAVMAVLGLPLSRLTEKKLYDYIN